MTSVIDSRTIFIHHVNAHGKKGLCPAVVARGWMVAGGFTSVLRYGNTGLCKTLRVSTSMTNYAIAPHHACSKNVVADIAKWLKEAIST
eukprot:scaffold7818_cov103-Amphora_coffeaeformis.AAC.2